MHALRELEPKIMGVLANARRYGAPIAAERLREAYQLLSSLRSDPLFLDLIPRLLDPSLLRQEIEVTTIRRVGRWYALLLFLSIFTLIVLLLAITAYLGWWPTVFHNAIALILPLSLPTGFLLISLYVFSIWRIHWFRHRANQIGAELSLQMQDITRGFLLSTANRLEFPRNSSDALNSAAHEIHRAIEQFDQVAEKLINTNQNAVQAIQGLNAEVKTRVGAFDGQITPALVNFSKDITTFGTTVYDYQAQLSRANTELTTVLRQLATTNAAHLNLEQRLSTQIEKLHEIQQKMADRTEAIVAAMSSTAQSVINITDRLAHQQHQSSSETLPPVQTGISPRELEVGHVFDVFLSYSNEDRSTVKAIAEQLKARGIVPWLDEWEMRPGVPWQSALGEQIPYIKSVVVFIGKGPPYPWQNKEMRAILREFVRRDSLVIPVILPECNQTAPELPAFLGSTTWVDFRQKNPSPLDALSWGITGRRVMA